MVVACLALFMAGTGTGVAVIKALPAGSVGTAQLKEDAVVSSKVKNHSLGAIDFAAGQLPRGTRGETGSTGASGATHVKVVMTTGPWHASLSEAEADCPSGSVATGGGVGSNTSGDEVRTTVGWDGPFFHTDQVPYGWGGWVSNSGSGTIQAVVYAICASP
jgi:hypothetical protein